MQETQKPAKQHKPITLNRTIGASLFFESANVNKQYLHQHCIASPTIYQADMQLLYPTLRTHPFRRTIRPLRTRGLSSP